jgi:hypothetical protein
MDDVNALFGGDAEPIDVPEVVEAIEQETAPVIEPAPVIEQPVAEKPVVPEGYVPVGVVKELRDEIRSLKNPPVQQMQPQEELYPDEDTLKIVNGSLRQQAMQFSRTLADDKYGADTVETAYGWAFERCNNDPAFNLAVAQSSHPFKFIVEEHRKAQSLQELGNVDPEQIRAFKQWQAAQAQTPALTPATPVSTTPPRSIASETSAGDSRPPKVTPEEEKLAKMF